MPVCRLENSMLRGQFSPNWSIHLMTSYQNLNFSNGNWQVASKGNKIVYDLEDPKWYWGKKKERVRELTG